MSNTNNINNKTTGSKVRDFIRYNNSVPLFAAIAIVLSGSAFAATPSGQQTISNTLVGQNTQVVSVDNTLIASVDLASWTLKIKVTGVTEDTENYYVAYTLSTIDIIDYKWQYTDKADTLKVDKSILVNYKSLEDYVQYELKQNIDSENDRLARTQDIEKKNVTLKQTVTSYSGLAGLVLDENTLVDDPVAPAPESKTPGLPPQPVQLTTTDPSLRDLIVPPPVENIPPTEDQQTPINNPATTDASSTASTTTPVIDTTVLQNSTTTDITATSSAPTTDTTSNPSTDTSTDTTQSSSGDVSTPTTTTDTPVTTTQ